MALALLTLDEMVAIYQKHVYFTRRVDYEMALLTSVAARLHDFLLPLEFCPYVLYWGPPDKGKTAATKFLCAITGAEFLNRMSPAALMRKIDERAKSGKVRMVGIDQFEEYMKDEKRDDVSGVMEVSSDPEGIYTVCDKLDGRQKPIDIQCGGMKAFNAIAPPRYALRTRTYEVNMAFGKTNSKLTKRADIATLSANLQGYADLILRTHPDNVKALESYVNSQHHSDGEAVFRGGRRLDLYDVYASVNFILGWGVDVIEALRHIPVDENAEVTRSMLVKVIQNNVLQGRGITSAELLQKMNLERDSVGMRRIEDAWSLTREMSRIGIDERYRGKVGGHRGFIFPANILDTLAPTKLFKQTTVTP